MSKYIDVEIDEEGNPTIAPKGYAGRECTEATKPAERALGLIDPKRRETPDMRKRPAGRKVVR